MSSTETVICPVCPVSLVLVRYAYEIVAPPIRTPIPEAAVCDRRGFPWMSWISMLCSVVETRAEPLETCTSLGDRELLLGDAVLGADVDVGEEIPVVGRVDVAGTVDGVGTVVSGQPARTAVMGCPSSRARTKPTVPAIRATAAATATQMAARLPRLDGSGLDPGGGRVGSGSPVRCGRTGGSPARPPVSLRVLLGKT